MREYDVGARDRCIRGEFRPHHRCRRIGSAAIRPSGAIALKTDADLDALDAAVIGGIDVRRRAVLRTANNYCRGVRMFAGGADSKLLRNGLMSMPPRRMKRAYTLKLAGRQRSRMSTNIRSTHAS